MGEVFLDKTISLLSSDKQRNRSEGLADLKHILQRKSSKLLVLNDKACHKIFESLFRFIKAERSTYKRASSRSTSALRLSTCASVIRMAVDLFLKNLRIKTVRAIIDHITEIIPVPGEGLWEPLSLDYTKSLASILRYRPHTEHLGENDWEKLIGFCLASIGLRENEESQLSIRSGRSAPEDPDASDSRSTPSRMTPTPVNRERHGGNRNSIEEVTVCIQLLTASPNFPLQAAQCLIDGLVGFVESPSITVAGNAHQLAFSSINAVVTKILFDQSKLVCSSLLGLLPVIRRLWATTKLQTLKDELLVTLMLSTVVLVDAAHKDPSDSLAPDIKKLANMLQSEYAKRSAKEVLQIDETNFFQNEAAFQRPIYGPRLGSARSEYNCTVIWMIAELLKLSDYINSRIKAVESRDEDSTKRQRFNSEIQDIFRDSISATGITKRICALQLVPFLESEIDIETKETYLKRLILSISDDNSTVSSWTMVALTRCVCQDISQKKKKIDSPLKPPKDCPESLPPRIYRNMC
jgi:ataxia telangiectasia mutated family protein